jgi:hypothetical protein
MFPHFLITAGYFFCRPFSFSLEFLSFSQGLLGVFVVTLGGYLLANEFWV